jgi:hypothetical protein
MVATFLNNKTLLEKIMPFMFENNIVMKNIHASH